ncbi:hypothetical protein E2562_039237 [Oryza meyeriana var. granulata]|uniref:Uncharacterized protein n=1 Tax=Oryza meyeriana var. granulata TaxID=110450 RepID=A0A6G1CMK3_9ORYZ|nr:hypothetical protein E2562_039237 [Oryza meyeriana var. granulata]
MESDGCLMIDSNLFAHRELLFDGLPLSNSDSDEEDEEDMALLAAMVWNLTKKRITNVSGSKFYYLKNEAVLLEMALVNWAITEVSKKGFTPLITPGIVRSSVVEKCGFQPRAQSTQSQFGYP